MLIGLQFQLTFAHNTTENIKVLIDGLPVSFDSKPIIYDGSTLVPFRAVAESISIKVTWIDETKSIIAEDGQNKVKMQINNKNALVNAKSVELDVAPIIKDSSTLIPLRFFSEAFGCTVDWDDSLKEVKIVSPAKEMTIIGYYAIDGNWKCLFTTDYPVAAEGNTNSVNDLYMGWYTLDKNGNLITNGNKGWQKPEGWEEVLEAANKYDINTEMAINMTDGDNSLTEFLSDENSMDSAVKNIVKEASLYKGVNIDFEGLGLTDKGEKLYEVKSSFTKFISLLYENLKSKNIKLSLALHAPNSSFKGYDYKELAKISDRIIIMAYDFGQKPEPQNLVIQAVEMAMENVPKEKLFLGISAPSENAESLKTKIGIAKRYDLEGIAIWRIGLISNEQWEALKLSAKRKGR